MIQNPNKCCKHLCTPLMVEPKKCNIWTSNDKYGWKRKLRWYFQHGKHGNMATSSFNGRQLGRTSQWKRWKDEHALKMAWCLQDITRVVCQACAKESSILKEDPFGGDFRPAGRWEQRFFRTNVWFVRRLIGWIQQQPWYLMKFLWYLVDYVDFMNAAVSLK